MTEPTEIWDFGLPLVGRKVLVVDEVGSTNDIAASLANDPANDGTAVIARFQTAGRGQHGRKWLAKPGDALHLSVLVFPPAEIRRPAIVTGWAAVCVAGLIGDVLGKPAVLKWPNDVLFNGKKLCGILAEQGRGTVVGIGVNLNQTAADFAAEELPDAGSLRSELETEQTFEVREAAREVLGRLDTEYREVLADGTAKLEGRWKKAFGLIDETVQVRTQDGARIYGRLREMAFDGLVVDTADGVKRLTPESVRHLHRAG